MEINACNKTEPALEPWWQRGLRGFFSQMQRVMSGYIWRDMSWLCVGEKNRIKCLTFLKVLSLTGVEEIGKTWSPESSLFGFIPSNTAIRPPTTIWSFMRGKKLRQPVKSETIHTLAWSCGHCALFKSRMDGFLWFKHYNLTYSSCLSENLCTDFSQESIIKIRLEITDFVNTLGFVLLFLPFMRSFINS